MKRSTRRAAVLGLCGSFAVVPVLGLIHHQQAPAQVSVTATGTSAAPAGVNDRMFADRASRSSFRVEDVGVASEVPDSATTDPTTTADPTTTTADPPPSTAARTVTPVTHPRRVISTTPTTRPRPVVTTTTTTKPAHSETGGASWYDAPPGTCAMNDAPIGTYVVVTDLATGNSVTCEVNSPGPFYDGRIIDLSQATFSQLAPNAVGVIQVRVTWS